MSETQAVGEEYSPERYIEKVSLLTGEVIDETIEPRQLLVHYHRDYHVVDVQARAVMSRMVAASGDEEKARIRMREIRQLGRRTADAVARLLKLEDSTKIGKALFGLKEKEYYFRYKRRSHEAEEIAATLARLRGEATRRLDACRASTGRLAMRVLLTGGTGFVGKELMWQAAQDPEIVEVVVVIRPKTIRDRKTKEVTKVLSPAERGEILLRQLWLDSPMGEKFRFVAGDVEKPRLGLSEEDFAEIARTITHVIHCAASVAFDDPYEDSFRANVIGTLHALETSLALQEAPGSPFVSHLGIETSYIHGRQVKRVAREDEIVFPRNFYNNYYELTKAMASLETERFMLDRGLRVVQLCPAIVIGESKAGNNRGDMKVVNAPVNLFGRAKDALGAQTEAGWLERSKASMLARMACVFPGDPSAELNLIPVDRVAEGILAALGRAEAVGERVHLATDRRVTSQEIRDMVVEEVGVKIKLAEPTIHRNVTLPMLGKVLARLKQERLASALDKLGNIFGGYAEWGQPIHEVGNDVRVLGLSPGRPDAAHCFRMLCRHNRYVQEFGKVRDLDEISRRERIWLDFIEGLDRPASEVPPQEFHRLVRESIDLETFALRS